jgi:hypothetical protein
MQFGKADVRGWKVLTFKDQHNTDCSIQESSLDGCIWVGINEPIPTILASKIIEGGRGWANYPIPEDVSINGRMHLTKEQARAIGKKLIEFAEMGELSYDE